MVAAQESTPHANAPAGVESMLSSNVLDLPKADEGIQVVPVGQGGSRSAGVVIH